MSEKEITSVNKVKDFMIANNLVRNSAVLGRQLRPGFLSDSNNVCQLSDEFNEENSNLTEKCILQKDGQISNYGPDEMRTCEKSQSDEPKREHKPQSNDNIIVDSQMPGLLVPSLDYNNYIIKKTIKAEAQFMDESLLSKSSEMHSNTLYEQNRGHISSASSPATLLRLQLNEENQNDCSNNSSSSNSNCSVNTNSSLATHASSLTSTSKNDKNFHIDTNIIDCEHRLGIIEDYTTNNQGDKSQTSVKANNDTNCQKQTNWPNTTCSITNNNNNKGNKIVDNINSRQSYSIDNQVRPVWETTAEMHQPYFDHIGDKCKTTNNEMIRQVEQDVSGRTDKLPEYLKGTYRSIGNTHQTAKLAHDIDNIMNNHNIIGDAPNILNVNDKCYLETNQHSHDRQHLPYSYHNNEGYYDQMMLQSLNEHQRNQLKLSECNHCQEQMVVEQSYNIERSEQQTDLLQELQSQTASHLSLYDDINEHQQRSESQPSSPIFSGGVSTSLDQQHHPEIQFQQINNKQISDVTNLSKQSMADKYDDIKVDKCSDEPSSHHKTKLSPTMVKHENQDDGYETSAGDVLTPNSNTSSTHSVTPTLHQIQHTNIGLLPPTTPNYDNNSTHQPHMSINNQHQSNIHVPLRDLFSSDLATSSYNFLNDDDVPYDKNNDTRNPLFSTTANSNDCQSNQIGYMNIRNSLILNNNDNLFKIASQKQLELKENSCHLTSEKLHHISPNLLETNGTRSFVSPEHNLNSNSDECLTPKRRGRKKKIQSSEDTNQIDSCNVNDGDVLQSIYDGLNKSRGRKKQDRFNGMSEEEIIKRILPDHLSDNLDILIIGINPGLFAAYKGHHYAGPGNHFWKCLYLSGLTQEQMSADEDYKLVKLGIGFTNMVQRPTKGSVDLSRKEIKEGSQILLEKIQRYRPKIAVFNGKLIFEVFSGKKVFNFGRQPECVDGTDTHIWVMPSSSARCAQLPRAADKVPFYAALKKFRDFLNGVIPHIDDSECVFSEERIKQYCEQDSLKIGVAKDDVQHNSVYCVNNNIDTNIDKSPSNQESTADKNYCFNMETKLQSVEGGPVPPNHVNNLFQKFPEKRKRGRPRKTKDPNSVSETNAMHLITGQEDSSNILNLSIVSNMDSGTPKKKRGRPKKIKSDNNINLHINEISQQINLTSAVTQTLKELNDMPKSNMDSTVMYNSYNSKTPPNQSEKSRVMPDKNTENIEKSQIKNSPTNFSIYPNTSCQGECRDLRLKDLSSPKSPNIFAPVNLAPMSTNESSPNNSQRIKESHNTENFHPLSHTPQIQSQQYSPNYSEIKTNVNNSQLWPYSQRSNGLQKQLLDTSDTLHTNQQISTPNYLGQNLNARQMEQHTQMQWPTVQNYSNSTNNIFLSSSTSQSLSSSNNYTQQQQFDEHNLAHTDVAHKSLSSLVSLVDQIPSISENESLQLLSAPSTFDQLNSFSNSHSHIFNNHSVNSMECISDSNGSGNFGQAQGCASNYLATNNVVPSSLATSSSMLGYDNYNTNSAGSLQSNGNSLYSSHPNFIATAVFATANAAASADYSATAGLSSVNHHYAPHSQMFIEPHATHLTAHVPVSTIYPTHHHPYHHHHHRHNHDISSHAMSPYGTSSRRTSSTDYININSSTYPSSTTPHSAIQMPYSSNYPYSYTSTLMQNNYQPNTTHPHVTHTSYPGNHFSAFERIKQPNVNTYGGF